MSDNKTIDNVHVHIYGHEMLGEVISRARKNNIPYDKEMKYDFHSHGHSYLVFKDGALTLLEDPTPSHYKETSLNYFFELYFSKEVWKQLVVGKWYKGNVDFDSLVFITEIEPTDTFNRIYGYGFIFDNYCKLGHLFSNTDHEKSLVEATPQEVEKALIEEAKRRGLVNGVKIKSLIDGESIELTGDRYVFCPYPLYFNLGVRHIFANGQWATIIEQDKPKEEVKVGGKVIGIRTDCAIVGEVTSVSKKKVCVNNLAFLKDQVSPLSAVQYDDARFLINGLKGHD